MNKINFANIILVSAVVFLFVGTSQVYAVSAAPNKTNITAEILSVQQIDSSSNLAGNFVKILEIKVIKYESVEGAFSVPDELKVSVHKRTNDLAIVDKLEKSQTITATISYSGDERGGMWNIREIKIIKGSVNNILYRAYRIPILIGGGVLIVLLVLIWLISKRRARIS